MRMSKSTPLLLVAASTLMIASRARAGRDSAEYRMPACRTVEPVEISKADFDKLYAPRARAALIIRASAGGEGAGVPVDLGEQKTATLGAYLTHDCFLMLKSELGKDNWATNHPGHAAELFSREMQPTSPGWTMTTQMNGPVPDKILVRQGGKTFQTDLNELLAARLKGLADIRLDGRAIPARYEIWSYLSIMRDDKGGDLHLLENRDSKVGWSYYDLTPFSLPAVVVRYDASQATLWELAPVKGKPQAPSKAR